MNSKTVLRLKKKSWERNQKQNTQTSSKMLHLSRKKKRNLLQSYVRRRKHKKRPKEKRKKCLRDSKKWRKRWWWVIKPLWLPRVKSKSWKRQEKSFKLSFNSKLNLKWSSKKRKKTIQWLRKSFRLWLKNWISNLKSLKNWCKSIRKQLPF